MWAEKWSVMTNRLQTYTTWVLKQIKLPGIFKIRVSIFFSPQMLWALASACYSAVIKVEHLAISKNRLISLISFFKDEQKALYILYITVISWNEAVWFSWAWNCSSCSASAAAVGA